LTWYLLSDKQELTEGEGPSAVKGETMKNLKILGLAAVAAMALAAFAAAPASAAVCSPSGSVAVAACTGAHGTGYQSTIEASLKPSTSAVLVATSSSGGTVSTVTCTTSVVSGKVTSAEKGTGEITNMTFANCSSTSCPNGVTASTFASTKAWPVTTTPSGKGDGNGTMTVSGVDGEFICGAPLIGNVTCRYSATANTQVTGGTTVTATNVPLTRTAGIESICGAKADWSGTYEVTKPSAVYIT
jgi:hypothetical protein